MPGVPHLSGAQTISAPARPAAEQAAEAVFQARVAQPAPADAVAASRPARPGRNAADPDQRESGEERRGRAERGRRDPRTGDFVRLSPRDGEAQSRGGDLFGSPFQRFRSLRDDGRSSPPLQPA